MERTWNGLWHCNPETGDVGRCYSLTRNRCPFGEQNHAYSAAGALQEFEKSMEPEKLATLKKGRPKLRQFEMADEKVFPLFSKAINENSDPSKYSREQLMQAVEGRSMSCPECGSTLGGRLQGVASLHFETYGTTVWCRECNRYIENTEAVVNPNAESPTYGAIIADNVKKMTWYHYSQNPEWGSTVLGEDGPDFIHLGGEQAASDRALSEGNSSDPYYLYVIEVTNDASVEEHIDQDDSVDYSPTGDKDVYRYLNRYEDTGSISLAVRPSKIKILGRGEFKRSQAEKVGTYNISPLLVGRLMEQYNARYEIPEYAY